jgi:poly-gamma-glutamate synthesis protein (capsule biosynthesis protein)
MSAVQSNPAQGSAGVTLFLCGDVMPGRGIDQLLRHPSPPELREPYIEDARDYVALAEARHGPIARPVGPEYPWGVALEVLAQEASQARVINLETAITTSDRFWPDKGINYRLHPANVDVLTCARIDACALANNHLLDFDRTGLSGTLDALDEAGIRHAGAGIDPAHARAPACVPLPGGGRLLLFSMGVTSSGIPEAWTARPGTPGVDLLPDLGPGTAADVVARVEAARAPGDLAIASIHWGSNWGHAIPSEHVDFAHRLIDGGVDLVHGHSSHHPRAIECYRERLVLYGCGDFINDYEGIRGHEAYRDELRVMYLPTLSARDGRVQRLRLVVLETWRLSLRRAAPAAVRWLGEVLAKASRPFATRIVVTPAGELELDLRSASTDG